MHLCFFLWSLIYIPDVQLFPWGFFSQFTLGFKMHHGRSKWIAETPHCLYCVYHSPRRRPADHLCSDFLTSFFTSDRMSNCSDKNVKLAVYLLYFFLVLGPRTVLLFLVSENWCAVAITTTTSCIMYDVMHYMKLFFPGWEHLKMHSMYNYKRYVIICAPDHLNTVKPSWRSFTPLWSAVQSCWLPRIHIKPTCNLHVRAAHDIDIFTFNTCDSFH